MFKVILSSHLRIIPKSIVKRYRLEYAHVGAAIRYFETNSKAKDFCFNLILNNALKYDIKLFLVNPDNSVILYY